MEWLIYSLDSMLSLLVRGTRYYFALLS